MRCLQPKLTNGGAKQEASSSVDLQSLDSLERDLDGSGIGPRGEDEIVLEAALVSVVDEVHAGIDLLVLHLRVAGDVSMPFG